MKREDRSLRVKIYMMLGVYVLFVLLLAVRAFQHQVINREEYLKWARDQQLQPVKLVPLRGKIVDRRGNLLAVSLKAGSLFAHPARFRTLNGRLRFLPRTSVWMPGSFWKNSSSLSPLSGSPGSCRLMRRKK
jgi:cell division protein FtsI/penicillin-binding protein 2